jgi:nicotinamidase-related amidase
MKELKRISASPLNSLLIVVDMQNEFCSPGGTMYSETSSRIMPGIISGIRQLTERFRHTGIPVIYIQSVRTFQEPEFTVFGARPMLKIGTPAVEIVDDLKPHPGDTIIQKFSHDPFLKPDLDLLLKKLVPDPTRCCAIVTGGGLNVCVYHTLMGFHLRNYWTILPLDCVYYLEEREKEATLQQLSIFAYPNIFFTRSDLIEVSRSTSNSLVRPL